MHPLELLWLFSRLATQHIGGMSAGWSCCAVGMVASCSPALSAWRPNKDETSEERRRNVCPRVSLFPALSKYLLRFCWASINNHKESPSRTWRHLSTDGRDVHFAATMPSQQQDWENRLHAWESHMLCSFNSPSQQSFPLLRWQDEGRGGIKRLHPTWQGPIWETGSRVFTMDTWPVLQKYWLKRPGRQWMALKGGDFLAWFNNFKIHSL